MVSLVGIRSAEVKLETGYAFEPVKAGWLKGWGRLNRVKAAEMKRSTAGTKQGTSLTDAATGEKF
jgi:hypothetical protein